MKKRSVTKLDKARKKAGKVVVGHVPKVSIAKRHDTELNVSSVDFCIQVDCYPLLEGIGSIGNVSGGYVRFGRYMRGNYVRDLRRDWEMVGRCLNESMKEFR